MAKNYIIKWRDSNGRVRETEFYTSKKKIPNQKEAFRLIMDYWQNTETDPNKSPYGIIDIHWVKKGEIFE
jgi:hypothetical protein